MIRSLLLALAGLSSIAMFSQCDGWQQRIQYDMDVALDVNTHQFEGTQKIIYWNNSPDTLDALFFHLYFNAFKPGSEMDVRSRAIADPDSRVGARIIDLTPEEQGDLQITRLTQGKKQAMLEPMGTVLKVLLPTPLLPGKSTALQTSFRGQVPQQIRRSGRDNAEGVAYSMAQWYPKLAEYDQRGWHAIPYVGREFHGVWGDFDVKLTLNGGYTVAATGALQDPIKMGHGYGDGKLQPNGGKDLTWHFIAKNVHDFAWAADKEFVHTSYQVPNGPMLHFFRKNEDGLKDTWEQLPEYMARSFQFMDKHFGKYPYPQYSFVQGGDGGMEYPMLTLITGKRKLGSLVGVSVHESVHSWYYGMLASNEGRYPWMDEGFTEFASSRVMAHLFDKSEDPHGSAYKSYFKLAASGKEEPMSTHADHFNTNFAYGVATYSKGEVLVQQLGSVIGDKTLMSGLLSYYNRCRFKHPDPVDVERIMEKESGLELDWYFDGWVNTTRQADYAISRVLQQDDNIQVTITRNRLQLMPVDVMVQRKDGVDQFYHIPLSLMLGTKPKDSESYSFETLKPWSWPADTYTFTIPGRFDQLKLISLDPTNRVADVDRSNDTVLFNDGFGGMIGN